MTPYVDNALRCAVPGHDTLGETPLWCVQTQSLLWLDIDSGSVQRFHPQTGRHDVFTFDAKYVGSLALTEDPGRVLVALDLALCIFDFSTGEQRLLCQVEPEINDNRLNDGRCDSHGRFWVGTMDNQLSRPNGSFYRVDPDGEIHRQFSDVVVSNTVAFSPRQDTLYFSDTRRFITWKFAFDAESGTLGERSIFVDHTQTRVRPDGACVDAEGFVWNAIFAGGRIVRFSPAGDVDRIIELPVTNPTCVCFGGRDLNLALQALVEAVDAERNRDGKSAVVVTLHDGRSGFVPALHSAHSCPAVHAADGGLAIQTRPFLRSVRSD